MDWLLYEKEAISKGYANVCGVDEAGRGPLAGPVYAAAVIRAAGTGDRGCERLQKIDGEKARGPFS